MSVAVLDRLHGLARLQPLLDDPSIRDIHISGHKRVWLNLRDGTKVRGPEVAESDEDLIDLIATAARRVGRSERRWDNAQPELNLQLPNGDRLHALMSVSGRPTVTVRRHDFDISRLDQLVAGGVCDDLLGSFLSAAVRARANLIVAGGTGTGKTTTLRCLINEIPADERLITIEDSLEIGLERFEDLHPDYESLEAREANTEGVGAFTMAELVRSALRMDPERVIVGEVRGAEVLPMLLAMSQGNDGSMCSIHADSSKGVFGRLADVRSDDAGAAGPRRDQPPRRQRDRSHRPPRLGGGRTSGHECARDHRHHRSGPGGLERDVATWRQRPRRCRHRRPHRPRRPPRTGSASIHRDHAAAEGWWR